MPSSLHWDCESPCTGSRQSAQQGNRIHSSPWLLAPSSTEVLGSNSHGAHQQPCLLRSLTGQYQGSCTVLPRPSHVPQQSYCSSSMVHVLVWLFFSFINRTGLLVYVPWVPSYLYNFPQMHSMGCFGQESVDLPSTSPWARLWFLLSLSGLG